MGVATLEANLSLRSPGPGVTPSLGPLILSLPEPGQADRRVPAAGRGAPGTNTVGRPPPGSEPRRASPGSSRAAGGARPLRLRLRVLKCSEA
eukprot:129325-Hanusia_phi.AAC.1